MEKIGCPFKLVRRKINCTMNFEPRNRVSLRLEHPFLSSVTTHFSIIQHTVKPRLSVFQGTAQILPSSGVAFKAEFSNIDIIKAHPIERNIYAFN